MDGVVITTPTHAHADLARRALRAGKHVMVEKPVAETLADTIKTIKVAKETGNYLFCAYTK